MPNVGDTKLRYPGNDPENGPACPHKWDGLQWVDQTPDQEDPDRDGYRFVSGDDLWEGASAGWYSFWDGDSAGPFDTEAEAQLAFEDHAINNEADGL